MKGLTQLLVTFGVILGYSTAQHFVSFEQFSQAVTSNSYPAPSRQQYDHFNQYARSRGQISSVEEASMALAQFIHETGGLQQKREEECVTSQPNCPNSYRCAGLPASEHSYCNCDHYHPDQYYYGRGYIQLSWCYNYRAASEAIFGNGDDLLGNPNQVADNEDLAWETAFWYWSANVHGKPGVAEGHFGATTNIINSGECRNQGAGGNDQAKARFAKYENVRRAFGLGSGNPAGCGG